MAWDPTPRVKFTVPFPDIKTDIYLDSVLPRVVEMAEGASERQTKVAACELLHSIVLFTIGTGAHHARRDASEVLVFPLSSLAKLQDNIFSTLSSLHHHSLHILRSTLSCFLH